MFSWVLFSQESSIVDAQLGSKYASAQFIQKYTQVLKSNYVKMK